MKHPILAAALAMLSLAACADPANTFLPAQAPQAELSRDAAVATAKRDAADRFQMTALPTVMASRQGRYWVIEMRSPDGAGLHYAIAGDGTIRERRVIQ
jgi:hypothetical protein